MTSEDAPDPAGRTGPQLFYNDTVIDHFVNPRNVGELEPGPGVYAVVVGDPACGDQLELWVEVAGGRLSRVRFRSLGCPGAIATSSMLTELACGRTLAEAAVLTDDEVVEALGGIPERKRHCSLLGVQALQAALAAERRDPEKRE